MTPAADTFSPRSIVIFRIGTLGDTLVALPALWIIRQRFPGARITFLGERHARYVAGTDAIAGSGLVDDVLSYPAPRASGGLAGKLRRAVQIAGLVARLRLRRVDTMVYLAPTGRSPSQVARDRKFFAMAGIRNWIGDQGFYELPSPQPGQPISEVPREADLLVARLESSGLNVPSPAQRRRDLNLQPSDRHEVARWLAVQEQPDGGRRWIAVGPGSKMPAKIWPADRYERVVRELIEHHDIRPVIFGGTEDRAIGQRLLALWGRGYNAAGALGIRGAAAAIGRCVMYLGNDTGTMHLAAAANVPCVAVFCSHSIAGLWYPLGENHRVFRTPIDCENCKLFECVDRQMECILRIGVEEVLRASQKVLETSAGTCKLDEVA